MKHKRKILATVSAGVFALGLYTQQAHGSEFCDRAGVLAYEIMKAKQLGATEEDIRQAAPSEIGHAITDLAFTTGQIPFENVVEFSRLFGEMVVEKCESSTKGIAM